MRRGGGQEEEENEKEEDQEEDEEEEEEDNKNEEEEETYKANVHIKVARVKVVTTQKEGEGSRMLPANAWLN